jgi:hypothetical protein
MTPWPAAAPAIVRAPAPDANNPAAEAKAQGSPFTLEKPKTDPGYEIYDTASPVANPLISVCIDLLMRAASACEQNLTGVIYLENYTRDYGCQDALTLQEASYPPVQNIPRAKPNMSLLQRTSHATHCPHNGAASYFSIQTNDRNVDNVVWSYEQPFPAVAEIEGTRRSIPTASTRLKKARRKLKRLMHARRFEEFRAVG